MRHIETGLLLDRIPCIKSGGGRRNVVVFFGVNALFHRIDQHNPARYAQMIARLLPRDCTFHILGYDQRPAGLDEIATDFAKILGDQIGRSTVVGISFGGFVAQRLAAKHPELLDRLILLVSAHRFSPEGRRRVDRQRECLRAADWPTLLRENSLLFRRARYNWLVRLKLWKDRHHLASRYNDPGSIAQAYECLFSPDFDRNHTFAARITSPTLILGGTHDQFFDEPAFRETAELIPASQLVLFPRETHMLPIEQATKVAHHLARFLDAPGPPPG